jgi:hypothetical protein
MNWLEELLRQLWFPVFGEDEDEDHDEEEE